MRVQFRKATLDDLHFLVTLRTLTMDEHLQHAGLYYQAAEHKERVLDHFNESLLIIFDTQLIGLLKLAQFAERLHIRQLQIMPDFQRQGIGNLVLKIIQRKAINLNMPITLSVLHDNPALALYQRSGFVIQQKNTLEYQMTCSVQQCQANSLS